MIPDAICGVGGIGARASTARFLGMVADPAPSSEVRAMAVRMVAAAEYFKVAGEIPSWARAEVNSWDDGAVPAATQPPQQQQPAPHRTGYR